MRVLQQNTTQCVPSATPTAVMQSKPEDNNVGTFGTSHYTKARAVREHYQARLAKLEYEERVRKLVPKDEVQASAFNNFRQCRDQLLNIPERVAAMLAAESEPEKVREILTSEVRRALNDFQRSGPASWPYAGEVGDSADSSPTVPTALCQIHQPRSSDES